MAKELKKLRLCPFCGEKPVVWKITGVWRIGCNNEKCLWRVVTRPRDEKIQAITAWNTRPLEDELLEALVTIKDIDETSEMFISKEKGAIEFAKIIAEQAISRGKEQE